VATQVGLLSTSLSLPMLAPLLLGTGMMLRSIRTNARQVFVCPSGCILLSFAVFTAPSQLPWHVCPPTPGILPAYLLHTRHANLLHTRHACPALTCCCPLHTLSSPTHPCSIIFPRVGVALVICWMLWFANSVLQNTVAYLRKQGAIDQRMANNINSAAELTVLVSALANGLWHIEVAAMVQCTVQGSGTHCAVHEGMVG